jgi:hypothetical protein
MMTAAERALRRGEPWLCRIGFHDDEPFGWGRGVVCLRCGRVDTTRALKKIDREKRAEQLAADHYREKHEGETK